MLERLYRQSWFGTAVLSIILLVLSVISLFIGVIDIPAAELFNGGDTMERKVFLLSRIPRLLAIFCTGSGMSIAGLIMQALCTNKFVSPTMELRFQQLVWDFVIPSFYAQYGECGGKPCFLFPKLLRGNWIFVWFIQRVKLKDAVMVPLVGIMFGNVIGGVTNFLAYKYEVTQQCSCFW